MLSTLGRVQEDQITAPYRCALAIGEILFYFHLPSGVCRLPHNELVQGFLLRPDKTADFASNTSGLNGMLIFPFKRCASTSNKLLEEYADHSLLSCLVAQARRL